MVGRRADANAAARRWTGLPLPAPDARRCPCVRRLLCTTPSQPMRSPLRATPGRAQGSAAPMQRLVVADLSFRDDAHHHVVARHDGGVGRVLRAGRPERGGQAHRGWGRCTPAGTWLAPWAPLACMRSSSTQQGGSARGTRLQRSALLVGQALLLQAAAVERHPVTPGGVALLAAWAGGRKGRQAGLLHTGGDTPVAVAALRPQRAPSRAARASCSAPQWQALRPHRGRHVAPPAAPRTMRTPEDASYTRSTPHPPPPGAPELRRALRAGRWPRPRPRRRLPQRRRCCSGCGRCWCSRLQRRAGAEWRGHASRERAAARQVPPGLPRTGPCSTAALATWAGPWGAARIHASARPPSLFKPHPPSTHPYDGSRHIRTPCLPAAPESSYIRPRRPAATSLSYACRPSLAATPDS